MTILYWILVGIPLVLLAAGAANWWLDRRPACCNYCERIVTDSFGTVCAHCRADNEAMRLANGGGE